MIDDHMAVAKLFCSLNSCFNELFETSLVNPSVRIDPDEVGERNRCNICPGCRGEIATMFNPVDLKEGTQANLFSAFANKPQYNVKEFVDYIWDMPSFSLHLFRCNRQRKNVRKRELKLFMFQLIAWGILVPIYHEESNTIVFKASSISEGEASMYNFQVDKS